MMLAYAQSADPNATGLVLILGGVVIVVICAALAVVLILVSRSRANHPSEAIKAAAILWAVLAAGSLLYAQETQMNWSKEFTLRLETGYFDPSDTADKPKLPWGLWGALGVAYVGILVWSFSQKNERLS